MTATATRRTAWLLLVAALVLGVCGTWRTWESVSNQPARPVLSDAAVEPTLAPPDPDGMVARVLVETRGGVRP